MMAGVWERYVRALNGSNGPRNVAIAGGVLAVTSLLVGVGIGGAGGETEVLRADLASESAHAGELAAEVDDLTEQLEAAEDERAAGAAEAEAAIADLVTLRNQLDDATAELDDLRGAMRPQDELDRQAQELEGRQARLDARASELEDAEAALAVRQDEIDDERQQLDDRAQELEATAAELADRERAVAAAPAPPASSSSSPSSSSSSSSSASDAGSTASAERGGGCRDGQVDINSAGIGELQRIIHIGPARAEVIPGLRPFSSVQQLTRISGIADARISDILAQDVACVR